MWKYYAFIYSSIDRSENILSLTPGKKPSEVKKIKVALGTWRLGTGHKYTVTTHVEGNNKFLIVVLTDI